jgi:hypothetical protein
MDGNGIIRQIHIWWRSRIPNAIMADRSPVWALSFEPGAFMPRRAWGYDHLAIHVLRRLALSPRDHFAMHTIIADSPLWAFFSSRGIRFPGGARRSSRPWSLYGRD